MSEKEKNEEFVEEQEESTTVEETSEEQAEIAEPVELTLEEQLAEAQAEVEKLRDSMLRVAAESDNFKKRIEREHSTTLKYAGENIFKAILPAVDNLERAVNQGVIADASAEQNLTALQEGVELTLKSLVSTLEKFEVKSINSLGEPFDPVTHEALTMEASTTVPANHVTNEFEKGYYYKDRLIRAAKVVVSSGE